MYHSCCAETKLTCFHPLLLSLIVFLRNEFFPPCLTFPCLLSVVESSCSKAPALFVLRQLARNEATSPQNFPEFFFCLLLFDRVMSGPLLVRSFAWCFLRAWLQVHRSLTGQVPFLPGNR